MQQEVSEQRTAEEQEAQGDTVSTVIRRVSDTVSTVIRGVLGETGVGSTVTQVPLTTSDDITNQCYGITKRFRDTAFYNN